ncbi:MAG TPA: penicillin-binding protein activator [Gammaproteobacteria bacterium]
MNRLDLALAACAAAAVLGLAACTPSQTVRPDAVSGLAARAADAREAGDLRTAAQLYRQLADRSRGTARAGYLIEGARLSTAVGDTAAAAAWLAEAEGDADEAQAKQILVLLAGVDEREGRAESALARLGQLSEPVPIPLLAEAQGIRGRALFDVGRAVDAVRTLVERETWLENGEAILENQRMIWEGLGAAGEVPTEPTGDEVVDGWLALAPIAASGVTGPELRSELLEWRRGHAGHPAAALLAELSGGLRGGVVAYPSQIAVLLPITSPQRNAAIAIRDGFLAAHFAARRADAAGGDPVIRVYDTGRISAPEAYRRAQLEGAEFIVGPLLRPEVDSIVAQAGLVPTLALNFVQADTSLLNGFYQFALWPEDEAQAVARRAFAAGARTAVALVPTTTWGLRLLDSFRTEFESLGGRFLGYESYSTEAQDFSSPIEALLHLDDSEQRRRQLAADLGLSLAFEPRRRQDVDMIFLAAPARSVGRLLAPALEYHFAGDIPTYATSDIYEPADVARDEDLNDIYFPDAPWLLRPDAEAAELRRRLQSYWPSRAASSNLRFYAMGVDAYELVGYLYGGSSDWPVDGLSGRLELDAIGRVHRLLPFAQFRNGRPVALEALPAPGLASPEDAGEIVGAR